MTVSRYIVSLLLAALVCIPAAAQVNDTHVIPVVGLTAGAGGTTWTSSVYVFNPQPYTLNISITFLETLGEIGDEVLLELPPNTTAVTDNVIRDWFGCVEGSPGCHPSEISGSGSLLFATFPEYNPDVEDSVVARSFLVRSRTFNTGGNGGTYGQAIPSTWIGLLDDGISSIAEGIRNTGTPGVSGYRTNVGAVNLSRDSVQMLIVVYDQNGSVVANTLNDPLVFTVPPYAHFQQPLPVVGQNLTLEFFLDDLGAGDGVAFPYVSVVDNRSGDAIYLEPKLLATGDILYKNGPAAGKNASSEITTNRFLGIDAARAARQNAVRIGVVRDGMLHSSER